MTNDLNKIINDVYISLDDIDKDFIILEGENNIIISAPHFVSQFRNKILKVREKETGVLAYLLNKDCKVHSIIKTRNLNDDANYDKCSNYKIELAKYIKENNIHYLLDLHMLSKSREVEINLGTRDYLNFKNKELIDKFINIFKEENINKIQIDKPFKAGGVNTISRYISTTNNIDALQIEINSKLLFNNDYNQSKFNNVFNALTKIIKELNNYEKK